MSRAHPAVLPLLAVLTWMACFAVLGRLGTWSLFVVAGPLLSALALASGVVPLSLLRPSVGRVVAGVAAGVVMLAASHAVFAALVAAWPGARGPALSLYALFDTGIWSPSTRAAFLVVVAGSEEVVFRGTLSRAASAHPVAPVGATGWWTSGVAASEVGRLALFALAYALGTLPLGNPLLFTCALCCGVAWGGLRLASRSLVTPLVAHVLWDVGVLLVWPLT